MGTVEDFAPQVPDLARHFKVIAFDRPGHGHTADSNGPFSYMTMMQDTVELIEKLKLGRISLLGFSDGAVISLLVAIHRHDLVRRLVCAGGSFNTRCFTREGLNWLRASSAGSLRNELPFYISRYDRLSPDGPNHFSVVLTKSKRMWMNEPNIRREELARIRIPTLIMAGDRDQLIRLEHTIELFRAIVNAELCIVPGSTHALFTEKPEVTTRLILDFLRSES